MSGKDLGSILNAVESGNVSAPEGVSMPNGAITTSLEKEKKKARMVFNTKIFYIADDDGAESFANFINWIMEDGKQRSLLREESTFTPTGELIRICDFLKKASDKSSSENYCIDAEEEEEEQGKDITREPVNEDDDTHVGERFTSDDYVPE